MNVHQSSETSARKYTNHWQETPTFTNAPTRELLIQIISVHVNTESLVFIFPLLPPPTPVSLQCSLYPITAALLVWSSSRCNTMETGMKYYLALLSSPPFFSFQIMRSLFIQHLQKGSVTLISTKYVRNLVSFLNFVNSYPNTSEPECLLTPWGWASD